MLEDALLVHWRSQVSMCAICTHLFGERFVVVELKWKEILVGKLCPDCLACSPRRLAPCVDQLASDLAERGVELSAQQVHVDLSPSRKESVSGGLRAAKLSHCKSQMRNTSPVVRAAGLLQWIQLAEDGAGGRPYAHPASVAAAAIDEAGRVKRISQAMEQQERWHTSLTDLIQREMLTTWLSDPDRSQLAVQEGVLDRYRHLLRAARSRTVPA